MIVIRRPTFPGLAIFLGGNCPGAIIRGAAVLEPFITLIQKSIRILFKFCFTRICKMFFKISGNLEENICGEVYFKKSKMS